MHSDGVRVEHDSMGEVELPAGACWGPGTERARHNFPPSGLRLPRVFVRALALIKWAAAGANAELGELPAEVARAVRAAADEVAAGRHDDQFPVDVFQTGSGTSSNMNANEVIAHLAHRACGFPVHPNDHVNRGQSSNDVIPTAIHLAASLSLEEQLLPALDALTLQLRERAGAFAGIVKTGRTHLMDAMPITLGQELGGWLAQLLQDRERLQAVLPRLHRLAQGGTAVGTGINAHPQFGTTVARILALRTGIPFRTSDNYFAALASQDTAVELSGQLRVLAVSLTKIANDLRWMNSGPLAGLGEIHLRELQPGSSIMPGKVNPVVPEAVAMIAAQVIGNDATIAMAGASGNFQLNVMLPVIAYNLLQSIEILGLACRNLAATAIAGMEVDTERLRANLARNPILVTALVPVLGYERGAAIAKQAYAQGRPILDVAVEMSGLPRAELEILLDPLALTAGGVRTAGGGA